MNDIPIQRINTALAKGNEALEVNSVLKDRVTVLDSLVRLQSVMIKNADLQISDFKMVVDLRETQVTVLENNVKSLTEDIRKMSNKNKVKNTVVIGSLSVGVGSLLWLLLTK